MYSLPTRSSRRFSSVPVAFFCGLIISSFIALGSAAAQVVRGTVVDDSAGVPVSAAQVVLLDAKGEQVERPARTNRAGEFILRSADPGNYTLRVTRIGYSPVTTRAFALDKMEVLKTALTMSRTSTVLRPMVVTDRSTLTAGELLSPEGFEYRRRTASGFFVDSATIRRFDDAPFTTIATTQLPGVRVMRTVAGTEALAMRVGGEYCIPYVFIDGQLIRASPVLALNSVISSNYYGIEAYTGRFDIPTAFPGVGLDPAKDRCGAIAAWTHWATQFVRR